MEYRNLEKVRTIIEEATGLEVAYAYDDLVFPDYTAFIIQFDDKKTTNFFCHFHEDCNEKEVLFKKLSKASEKNKCSLSLKGSFRLAQKNEEVELIFN